MIVDTLGLIIVLVVHAANIQDRDGGKLLIKKLGRQWRRLEIIWADGGYAGKFVHWARGWYGRVVEIVHKQAVGKFVVLPKRWIVERTFGWFGKYRRLAKDDEELPRSSECMILIAMINTHGASHQPGIEWLLTHALRWQGGTEFSRMGFLLHQKYGDEVFQILLHDGHYESLEGAIRGFIEQIAHRRQDLPVGFDVEGSPFALLRDSDALFFRHQPGACFSDLAAGYVFLKPIENQETCDWLEGYISEDMFVKNKPYCEAKCGRKLASAEEANRFVGQR